MFNSTNNEHTDNSIMINGDVYAPVASGYGARAEMNTIYYNDDLNWNGLQNDINKLNDFIKSPFFEIKNKNEISATLNELQSAVNSKNKSSVSDTIKKASKSTITFLLNISKQIILEVLPKLILKFIG